MAQKTRDGDGEASLDQGDIMSMLEGVIGMNFSSPVCGQDVVGQDSQGPSTTSEGGVPVPGMNSNFSSQAKVLKDLLGIELDSENFGELREMGEVFQKAIAEELISGKKHQLSV